MILFALVSTGRAACRDCGKVIPKGQPCAEVSWQDGSWRKTTKICLPCLEAFVRKVREAKP